MQHNYLKTAWLVLLLSLLGTVARAQSGPYGNEWVVPGQQYYKVKVAKEGIYRLNYAYLQNAGLSSADPRQLQLWRRGKQVAIHVGGSATTLDGSSFVEFFGQRNDGQLDRGMYKNIADQTHSLYSLYTDTAAYFLTVSPTTQGKRMAQPQLSASAPQPNWLGWKTQILANEWASISEETLIYKPWMEAGEGFLSKVIGYRVRPDGVEVLNLSGTYTVDSLTAVTGDPVLEVLVVGFRATTRTVVIKVVSGTNPRDLGSFALAGLNKNRFRSALRSTDIGADGKLKVEVRTIKDPGFFGDNFVRVGYVRVTYPQKSQWKIGQKSVAFLSDSTLAGPIAYQFDNLPATVVGYDVTDPDNVVRVLPQTGSTTQVVFAAANGSARALRLHDLAKVLTPSLPAQSVRFRSFPATANFLVVSAKGLMKPTTDGATANAVRSYADYRASVAGGRYDTLTVSTEELYDQFHYGEKSALAIRQFTQWMLATGGDRPRYLLLLGKGYETGTTIGGKLHRQFSPAQYRGTPDYVPTSSRGASDIFFTADWQNGSYVSRMATGRVAANNPDQIISYLNKLREHEALGLEPWRRNVLLLAGGETLGEPEAFKSYLEEYGRIMQKPFFGGRIVRFLDRIGQLGVPTTVNIVPQVNEGLSIISYVGHGNLRYIDLNPTDIRAPASGYANKGRYPVLFFSGCVAGNAFTGLGSTGEDWMLLPDKGCVGFMSNSSLDIPDNIDQVDRLLYELLLNDPQWYGKPVVEVQAEVFRRLQTKLLNNGNNPFAIPALMSTIWQGDPALRLFSPERPDFQTADSRLQLAPSVVPSTPGAEFELRLGVSNPGKITQGPLPIRVTRTVGSRTSTFDFVVLQARQDTTYTLALTNPAIGSITGQNTFQVDIDPDNTIPELDETNNRATLNYTFLTGGVTLLSPPEFAIVGSEQVRLVAQSNVPTTSSREYDLELDTTQTFSTPLQQVRLSAVMVPEWTPALPMLPGLPDSVVWYWRARLHAPQGDESSDWAVSSFRVIKGRTQGGWSQSHPGQFRRDERNGIEVAVPGGEWTFNENTRQATITSTRIGPARQWETLYHTIRTNGESGYTLKLLGVDTLGNTTVLNPNVTSQALALNSVSAKLYRYLQLQATLTANASGPAPQLTQWLVTYQGVPEGVVRPSATLLTAAQLTEQAQKTGSVTVPVNFQNVSDFDFKAPLVGYMVLRSGTTGVPRERYYALSGPALLAHTQQTYNVTLDARGLYGTLSGQVVLNPRRQPEQNYFNNEVLLEPFEVLNNDTPPVLDVAFDGRHLLNGEIVSPRPSISIQLRDLDKLRPIAGRDNFLLVLSRANEAGQAIDLNGASITSFQVDSAQGLARMVFEPGKKQPLVEGIYTLEVQGKDGSGNAAGTEPYRITFEVILGSGITNVFPYPNPVTSKTRFVFTLTGETVPRNMKIQIVSLTGRVVKEIMMEDMGPLRIGNNITEQYWDGTDTYGDRLANGTYLYRVVLDDPNGEFKHRTTTTGADKAFKKDWGKLVLLR